MKALLFSLFLLLSANPALAALALDGSNTGGTVSGSTIAITLTTTSANDVLILQSTNTTATAYGINSVTDSAGNTWSKRIGQVVNGIISNEEWYAISPNAQASLTITTTYASAPSARVFVMGVSGANIGTPFDPSFTAALGTSTTSGTANTITYSTTSANDILLSFVKVNTNFGTLTPPSGTTAIQASPYTSVASYYKIISTTQTSASNTYSWTTTGADSVQVLDAIQQASASTAKPSISNTAF